MRPIRRALAAALALAAAPAAAYVQTTDRISGTPVSWPTPIVTYHVNPDAIAAATSPSCGGGAGLAEVRIAFSEWQDGAAACSDLRMAYGGTLSETAIGISGSKETLVVFRKGWCSQVVPTADDPCFTSGDLDCATKYDCWEDGCGFRAATCNAWGTLAQTTVLYDPATGRIFNSDLEVNGWDGVAASLPPGLGLPSHGWYFTCWEPTQVGTPCNAYGQDGCWFVDLRNVVTHEAGHVIGLAHSGAAGRCTAAQAAAVMAPTSQPGDVAKRHLTADDRDGVCAVYPKASGGCGCGGGAGAGALSLLLGAVALRRRARGPARG